MYYKHLTSNKIKNKMKIFTCGLVVLWSCSLKKTIFAKNSNHGLQGNFKEIQQQIYHCYTDICSGDNLR